MPNYKESSVAGSVWQRAYKVIIDNVYNSVPTVTFNEEEIISTGTTNISKHISSLVEHFNDPTKSFPLINPLDGTEIGTATYQDVYVLLSSLYINLANQRDQASQ